MSASAEIVDPVAVPLPWLSGVCLDDRYPKVSGDWVVGCKGRGTITRAWNLRGRFGVQFESLGTHPALSDGLIVDFHNGLAVDLNSDLCLSPVDSTCPVTQVQRYQADTIGPYDINGSQVSASTRDGIYLSIYGSNQRELLLANPASWYPSAVGDGWVAWSEPSIESGVERGLLWSRLSSTPVPIGQTDQNVRHLTSSGDFLGWIEDDSVIIARVEGGQLTTESRILTDAHTSSSLSLSGHHACWESWGDGVDVECSNGRRIGGEGDQRYPSHSDEWLVYRVNGVTMATVFVVASYEDPQEEDEPLD